MVRLGTPPAGVENPPTEIGGGEPLATHLFWTVPGSPQAAIAFLKAHPVSGTALGDSGSSTSDVGPLWFDQDVGGTYFRGDITPEAVAAPGGTSVLGLTSK